MTRLALIGSRDYPALDRVRRFALDLPHNVIVVSGGARGVDSVAEETARAAGLDVVVLEADGSGLGRRAGLVRNQSWRGGTASSPSTRPQRQAPRPRALAGPAARQDVCRAGALT